ncbi:Histone acetyltransferase [Ceratobasidium theobromae]|uniref:Histone acetyltransferase n=1 Tax=Ceratobasidium theobromae TaxID=1582974 RepID=A0A5N5QUI2_9AGAM|nr:Histone acetyltransferase [Ceratobasidium theobromae]
MTSRSTRGMASLQDAIDKLSIREKLLLSQAIYECGSSKWDEVSKLIVSHPLTERPNTFFSPINCHAMYNHLMRDVGYNPSNPPPGDTTVPKADAHKRMAFHFYQQHVQDLKALIAAEETRFKTLTAEIEEINSGKWDDKILADINSVNTSDSFARPSASPLPKHLSLNLEDISLHAESDAQRVQSPIGPTRDGTPIDAGTPRTIPGSPATIRSKPVSTASSGSRPWNSKDNKRVREMKERRARELERLSSLIPDTSEVQDDAPPSTPIVETPQTPVVGLSVDAAPEVPTPAAPESSAEVEAVIVATPQTGDAVGTPVTAPEVIVEAPEEVVESSQPTEEAKGTKGGYSVKVATLLLSDVLLLPVKRRVSDVSMVDTSPDPKRARQEDTEMKDAPATEPTQSPEPPAPQTSVVAPKGSAAPTPAPTPSVAPPPAAPPAPVAAQPSAATNKRFQNVITLVHQQIYQHRGGNIFHNPIKKSEAPDYYEIVRRPMDLKTVKARIKDGVISSADHFKRDVFLMFANAIMFNRPGTSLNDIAAEMMIESERHIADFRAAEEFNKPARG